MKKKLNINKISRVIKIFCTFGIILSIILLILCLILLGCSIHQSIPYYMSRTDWTNTECTLDYLTTQATLISFIAGCISTIFSYCLIYGFGELIQLHHNRNLILTDILGTINVNNVNNEQQSD